MFFSNRSHRPLIWTLSAALLICGAVIFHLTKSRRLPSHTGEAVRAEPAQTRRATWQAQPKVGSVQVGATPVAGPQSQSDLTPGATGTAATASPRPDQRDERDVQLDRDARTLATKLHSANPEDAVELRKQLESVIERHFEYRQQQRKQEIDQLSQRIDALRLSQVRRQENKAEVVKRRLNDLVDPTANLDWDTSGSDDAKKADSDRRQGAISKTPPAPEAVNGAEVGEPMVAAPPELPAPSALVSSSSGNVTYKGRPIAVWLAKLETERDPSALVAAVDALQHLSADIDSRALVRATIQMSQSMRMRVPFEWDLRHVTGMYPDIYSLVDRSTELLRSTPPSILVETLTQQLETVSSQNVTGTFQAIFNALLVTASQVDQTYVRHSKPTRINKGLAREFSEHAQEVIDALTVLVKSNDRLEEWVVDCSVRILALNEGTLSDYPDLIPMVERFMLSESNAFDMRGEAAVILGRSGVSPEEVLAFLQLALEPKSQGDARQFRQKNDRRVRAWIRRLAPEMPEVVMLIKGPLSDQTGNVEIHPESENDAIEWIRLLQCLVDLRECAESTVPWLRQLAEKPVAERPTPYMNLTNFDGKPIRSHATIRGFLTDAIQQIEFAVHESKSRPIDGNQGLRGRKFVGAGLALKPPQTSSPVVAPREPTFDGRAYSSWLEILENERKPEMLEAAIDACSRLAQPKDQVRITRGILQAASMFQKGPLHEQGHIWNAAFVGLHRLTGEALLDVLMDAVRGKVSPPIDRIVQFRIWDQVQFESFVEAVKAQDDAVIAELGNTPASGQITEDDLIAFASCVWRSSGRPLDDFPGLKKPMLELVAGDRGLLADGSYGSPWLVVASNLIARASETHGLSLMVVKQAKSRAEVVQLLGRLGPAAEAAVPALVELFLEEQRSFLQRSERGDFLAYADTSEYLTSIVTTIGNIGIDPTGYALLEELKLAIVSYYGTTSGSQISRAVVDAFARYTAPTSPEIEKQLLDDRVLINGLWTIRETNRHPGLSARVLIEQQNWKYTNSGAASNRIPYRFEAGQWRCEQFDEVTVLTRPNSIDSLSPETNGGHPPFEYRILNKFWLDMTPPLKQITFQGTSDDGAEVTQFGIYELTDTKLRVQLAPIGGPRPIEFVSDEAALPQGHMLLEFERKLDRKQRPSK